MATILSHSLGGSIERRMRAYDLAKWWVYEPVGNTGRYLTLPDNLGRTVS
jgi:hypothetical protein